MNSTWGMLLLRIYCFISYLLLCISTCPATCGIDTFKGKNRNQAGQRTVKHDREALWTLYHHLIDLQWQEECLCKHTIFWHYPAHKSSRVHTQQQKVDYYQLTFLDHCIKCSFLLLYYLLLCCMSQLQTKKPLHTPTVYYLFKCKNHLISWHYILCCWLSKKEDASFEIEKCLEPKKIH